MLNQKKNIEMKYAGNVGQHAKTKSMHHRHTEESQANDIEQIFNRIREENFPKLGIPIQIQRAH